MKSPSKYLGALRSGEKLRDGNSFTRNEVNALLHDLRVHHSELEIQNEELRQAQDELEKARTKYFDLYDLAPVGFFTLGEKDKILEANLCAANLLELEKSRILNRPFSNFVKPEFQDLFYFHSAKVRKLGIQETCELKLTVRVF